MTTTINVGLQRNDGRENNTIDFTLGALAYLGFDTDRAQVGESETEQTIIAQHPDDFVTGTTLEICLQELCTTLAQDCVAVSLDNGKTGELIGPKAQTWGPFNPDFSIRYINQA